MKQSAAVERQRVDVWLWRARFAKTRAAAARLVAEGGVRVLRDGAARRLDKPSATLAIGDELVFPQDGELRSVRVEKLPARRGPPEEARGLYADLDVLLRARADASA